MLCLCPEGEASGRPQGVARSLLLFCKLAAGLEAVACVIEHVVGLDGVLEAAGLADHGCGAIAHGDELREAAGLERGGHEQDVACRASMRGKRFLVFELSI